MSLWQKDVAGVSSDVTAIRAAVEDSLVPDDTDGTFSYLDAGGEQDVFEITGSSRKFIAGILLDLSNMTENGTIRVYSKIDGSNYRLLDEFYFTVATDPDGFLLNVKVPISVDFKVTYEESADEGAARDIPYAYVLEG